MTIPSQIWTGGVMRCFTAVPGFTDGKVIDAVHASSVSGESQSSCDWGWAVGRWGGDILHCCQRQRTREQPLGSVSHANTGIAASITRCRLTGLFCSGRINYLCCFISHFKCIESVIGSSFCHCKVSQVPFSPTIYTWGNVVPLVPKSIFN